jgi:hypothetical protein
MLGGDVLHPLLRPLTSELIQLSHRVFQELSANTEDFVVHAPDGVLLRGWRVRPRKGNGDWVLLFHGMSDNRTGTSNAH